MSKASEEYLERLRLERERARRNSGTTQGSTPTGVPPISDERLQELAKDRETITQNSGRRSVLGQVWDQIRGTPKGLGQLALDVSKVGPTFSNFVLQSAKGNVDYSSGWNNPGEKFTSLTRQSVPLGHEIGASFVRTLNGAGIGQQENIINRYKTSWDEGRIVNTAIEDVGNVALAGGIAAKILGRTAGASAVVSNAARTASISDAAAGASRFRTVANQLTGKSGRTVINPATQSLSSKYTAPMVRRPSRVRVPGDQVLRGVDGRKFTVPGVPRNTGSVGGKILPGPNEVFAEATRGKGVAGRLERAGRLEAAAKAEKIGQISGRVGMAVDWLDPATPMMVFGGRAVGKAAGPAFKGISSAMSRVAPERTARTSQRFESFIDNQKNRIEENRLGNEARAAAEALGTLEQRAQLTNLNFMRTNFENQKVPKDVGRKWEAVVLSAVDLDIDSVYKLIVQARTADLPQSSIDNIINGVNRNKPAGTDGLTLEIVDAYGDYIDGRLASSNPDLYGVIDETVKRSQETSREVSEKQLALGNILDEQMRVPTRVSDGVPLTELGAIELQKAFADGDVNIPYKQTWLDKKRNSYLENAAKIEVPIRQSDGTPLAELDIKARQEAVDGGDTYIPEAYQELYRLERERDLTEAAVSSLPAPGTDIPVSRTLEGRQLNIGILKMTAKAMEQRLDALVNEYEGAPESVRDSLLEDIEVAGTNFDNAYKLVQESSTLSDKALGEAVAKAENALDITDSLRDQLDDVKQNMASTISINKSLRDTNKAAADATANINIGLNTSPSGVWDSRFYDEAITENPKRTITNSLGEDYLFEDRPKPAVRIEDTSGYRAGDSKAAIEDVVGKPVEVIVNELIPSPYLRTPNGTRSITIVVPEGHLPERTGTLEGRTPRRMLDLMSAEEWAELNVDINDPSIQSQWDSADNPFDVKEPNFVFHIEWSVDTGKVELISTYGPYRGTGIASQGAKLAVEISQENGWIPPTKSDNLTNDGKAFHAGGTSRYEAAYPDQYWRKGEGIVDDPNGPDMSGDRSLELDERFNETEEFGVETVLGPPREGTRRANDIASQVIEANAIAEYQVQAAKRNIWIAEQKRAAWEYKASNLEKSLDISLQTKLIDVSRSANVQLQQTLVNSSSERLGGISENGRQLDGLVGKLELQYRNSGLLQPGEVIRLANEIANESSSGGAKPNFAAIALKSILGDELGLDLGRLNEAIVAEQLAGVVETFLNTNIDGQMMDGWAGYDMVRSEINRIQSETPDLAAHISDGLLDSIADQQGTFIQRFNREMDMLNEARVAAVPTRFRVPLQQAHRAVRAMLIDAQDYWHQGRMGDVAMFDVARGLDRIAMDAPTSFAMYAEQGLATPDHLTGGPLPTAGKVGSGTKITEVAYRQARAQSARTSSARLTDFQDHANLMAREMTNISRQQGILAAASNSKFSRSIYQVLGEPAADGSPSFLDEWRNGKGAQGGRLSMAEMEIALNERGYAVVWGATPTSKSRPRSITWDKVTPAMDYVDNSGNPMAARTGMTRDGSVVNIDNGQIIRGSNGEMYNPDVQLPDLDSPDFPDIRVVPTAIAKQLNDFQNPRSGFSLTMYDQAMQGWKTIQLAWSIGWVTYNAFGNAMMATLGGGMGPTQLVKELSNIRNHLRQIDIDAGGTGKSPLRKALKTGSLIEVMPAELAGHGLSFSEKQMTRDITDTNFDGWQGAVANKTTKALEYMTGAGQKKSVVGRLTEFTYNLNEFTDNLFRTAVYADKARKLAPEIPASFLNDNGDIRTDLGPIENQQLVDLNVEALDAHNTAIKQSLNIMGDFNRLTPVERRVIKRALPFYPWLRHQMQMTMRLPFNNPLRWAFIMSIVESDDETLVGEILNSTIPTPWGRIDVTPANPFSGLTPFASGDDSAPFFSARQASQIFSPVVKPLLEIPLGLDLSNASSGSRPREQKDIGRQGEEVNTSAVQRVFSGDPIGGAKEIAYRTAGSTRLTRALRDVVVQSPWLGGDERPRYDDGSVVKQADKRNINLPIQLGRVPGLPFLPRNYDAQLEEAKRKDRIRLREALRKN
jgi:hypothetical protein